MPDLEPEAVQTSDSTLGARAHGKLCWCQGCGRGEGQHMIVRPFDVQTSFGFAPTCPVIPIFADATMETASSEDWMARHGEQQPKDESTQGLTIAYASQEQDEPREDSDD